MSWPLASHFSAMLQNPRLAFRDPQLQQCTIEKNEQNQPRPWAGAFAVVYKGVHADGRPVAVRIFTTESPERRERYDLISDYFKQRKLKCLVDFEYRDRSIRSAGDGKWYPLILMEWVQGETLFKWARARCLVGDGTALGLIADRWVEAVRELAIASVAHGDLQHANIMVTTAGEVRLVDYDGVCVPGLVGRRNLEVGVEPYQHPDRNERTLLSLELDHFSALLIYVALRALAINPGLWDKYVERPGYDKLLFRREDFRSPRTSALYQDLMRLGNVEFRELARQLFALCRARMDQVPPLTQLVSPYTKVERLLRAKQWGAAVEWLNRRGNFRDAPKHLRPLINRAYEEVCREEAWTAFSQIPGEASEQVDRKLVQSWNETLFAGFPPAEQERMRVAEARRRLLVVDRLCHLAQELGNRRSWDGEKSLADAAAKLPQGYQYTVRERVERARRCVVALARLERALREAASEAAIVAAWRGVVEAKYDRMVSAEARARIARAEQRAPFLKTLAEIPADLPVHQRDARILAAWPHDVLADCPEAARWRAMWQEASARRDILKRLETAIATGDEAAVLKFSEHPLLAGYPLADGWAETIAAAAKGRAEADSLVAALAGDDREAFCQAFDVALVRRYADRFAPYQDRLAQWMTSESIVQDKLELQPAAGQASLAPADEPKGGYRVDWSWPEARWADACLLAVSRAEPAAGDAPETLAADYRIEINRDQWRQNGSSRLLPAAQATEGGCVVAWAVADLGFRKFYGRPLVLGHLAHRGRWKWPGLGLFSRRERT